MGCWGITAFESDEGLDAVDFIRRNLPDDGKLEAKTMIQLLKDDIWCAPSDTADGESHTSPMAFAEIMVKFLDRDMSGLDYEDAFFAKDRKFASLTSFTADRESIQWVRDYLENTLRYSRKEAAHGRKWGGWYRERDWRHWQAHMEQLISRMDQLLVVSEDTIELIQPTERKNLVKIRPEQEIPRMQMN